MKAVDYLHTIIPMNISDLALPINRDEDLLAPFIVDRARDAIAKSGLSAHIFEGWRSPQRQNQLYDQGRTKPGKIVTNRQAWESIHQYGLAVDVAFKDTRGNWTWVGDWEGLTREFQYYGFRSLAPLEKAHFQIDGGLSIREIQAINKDYGQSGLWAYVKTKV